jgi:aminomethyltransferase
MKRTAFYDQHRDLGGRLIQFAGWEMPVQYSSIRQEHHAVRNHAGLFDVSHMGNLIFTGEGATEFLSWLLPFDCSRIQPGREFYTHILNEQGIILDDTIVMRMAENEYLMVPNAATTTKILAHIKPLLPENVTLTDRSLDMQCIALQGPQADEILSDLTDHDLSTIGFFQFTDVPVTSSDGSADIIVSASGYTGESGYELYTDREFGPGFWNQLMSSGKEHGIEPCGLGARDTLRLEKGFLLSGTDFNDDRTMLETGCEWALHWDHEFLGKHALATQKEQGNYERFTGFVMEGKAIPRHGMEIMTKGRVIGKVTSGTISPTLGTGIALGYIAPEHRIVGSEVQILVRGKPQNATIREPPFV